MLHILRLIRFSAESLQLPVDAIGDLVFVIALQLSYECLWFAHHFLPVFLPFTSSQHDAKHIKDDAYVLRWNFEFGDKLQVI